MEFEFLHEVLTAFKHQIARGRSIHVIIKVRPNGYAAQYRAFVAEYFPDLDIEIMDLQPMRGVLDRTDFLVSIYSQTLFEASCLGIPSVYHKVDVEVMDPPFDCKSELVTTTSVDELDQALDDFFSGSDRFDAFLDRTVMEKYIGPLDGKNLQRNYDFVKQMLRDANA